MKSIVIARLAPGVDNVKKSFEVFGRVGATANSQNYAGADGKTFVSVIEADEPDMVTQMTFAPFLEDVTVIPVVDMDDAWVAAVGAAIANVDG